MDTQVQQQKKKAAFLLKNHPEIDTVISHAISGSAAIDAVQKRLLLLVKYQ